MDTALTVRGTAFLARRATLIAEKGQGAWDAFLADHVKREPYFDQAIFPITRIPAPIFLAINDALLQRFYGADDQHYWSTGEKSAEWAFKEGPNRTLFFSNEQKRFLSDAPSLWKSYFSAGRAVAEKIEDHFAELHLLEVPIHHVYFEYSVMGYINRGLALCGASQVSHTRVRGFSVGDPDVVYRFEFR